MVAHEWNGNELRVDGKYIVDEYNRKCFPRGVNLSGGSKLPSNRNPFDRDHFFDHSSVSFVGRPFDLKDAHFHLSKLSSCGLTFVRLLVTWEAIEHAGIGQYDVDYLNYLKELCLLFEQYGIVAIVNAHQDIWSRFTGGSGAPGWTVELAGFDLHGLEDTCASYVYPLRAQKGENWEAKPGDGLEEGVWPAGYQKAAAGTMATLFWGGKTFAPSKMISLNDKLVNIQDVLQDCYIKSFSILAKTLRDCSSVIGFELMNEPHRGYIELESFHSWNYNTDLHIAHHPTPLQSWVLASGYPARVPYYTRSFPFPTMKTSSRLIKPQRSAFKEDSECPWKVEKIWQYSSEKKKGIILREDYFKYDPKTNKKINWYYDFYFPFVERWQKEVTNKFNEKNFTIVEPIPNEFYPRLSKQNQPKNFVAGPHWYDLNALFKKTGTWWSVNVQGLARGMMIWNALYIGKRGLDKNYFKQISNIVNFANLNLDGIPIIFGECGIPMDLNKGCGYINNDWKYHKWSLDSLIKSLESNFVGFTLWNYNPNNFDEKGDVWNGENFSLYSNSCLNNDGSQIDGLRIPEVLVRPYISKLSGELISINYNYRSKIYNVSIKISKGINEIFVPNYIYPTIKIKISGGKYNHDKHNQTLYWDLRDAEDGQIVNCVIGCNTLVENGSDNYNLTLKLLLLSLLIIMISVIFNKYY